MSARERWTFHVTGRVQGVGYRAFALRAAAAAGVGGFVRNERDGSVYAEAEGERAALERFAAALRAGPRWGRVDDVAVGTTLAAGDGGGEGEGFHVR